MSIIKNRSLHGLPFDLKEKARQMAQVYQQLYAIENILRLLIEEKKNELNFSQKMQKVISIRKDDEAKHTWLSFRGNSDVFYLDFVDLGGIISSNWSAFKEIFPSQEWITSKINDLARFRNIIAHNSYIDDTDREFIVVISNTILKQLNISDHNHSVKNGTIDEKHNLSPFIEGLVNSICFKYDDIDEAITYTLEFPEEIEVTPDSLSIYFYQVGLVFQANFLNARVWLHPNIDSAYEGESREEGVFPSDNLRIQVGQFDIDGDGIKELFIGAQTYAENNYQGVVIINVFKYYPPAFKEHSNRPENWEKVLEMKVDSVLGEPKAFVEGNSVTVHRNLRGFYLQNTWVENRFVETGI